MQCRNRDEYAHDAEHDKTRNENMPPIFYRQKGELMLDKTKHGAEANPNESQIRSKRVLVRQ